MHYLPGKENIFSDALSRLVDVKDNGEELDQMLLSKINVINDSNETNCDTLNSYILVKIKKIIIRRNLVLKEG